MSLDIQLINEQERETGLTAETVGEHKTTKLNRKRNLCPFTVILISAL